MSQRRGFTLVELMVVIVIIGILASLAIPKFVLASSKSKATEFRMILKQMYDLEVVYQHENDVFTSNTTSIGMDPIPPAARFTYTIDAAGVTFIGSAEVLPDKIGTFTGTATIIQDGRGGVAGTLAQISSWRGIGQ